MRCLILILPLLLIGCSPTIEFVPVNPAVDPETFTPCPISARVVRTANDLAALALENLQSARCANSKIEAIAAVLPVADGAQLSYATAPLAPLVMKGSTDGQ